MAYPNPTWLEDFGIWLQSNGWGTEAVDLFTGIMPDTDTAPAAVIAVLASPASRAADLTFGPGGVPQVATSYPRASLFFRDAPNEQLAPLARASHLYEVLLVTFGVNVGANHYKRFAPMQEPAPIGGKDGTDRWTIGFNVEIHRNL